MGHLSQLGRLLEQCCRGAGGLGCHQEARGCHCQQAEMFHHLVEKCPQWERMAWCLHRVMLALCRHQARWALCLHWGSWAC